MEMKAIDKVTYTLLVIGGLNWGLVGVFKYNLVFIIDSPYVWIGEMLLIIRCKHFSFTFYVCCAINGSFKNTVMKMPGIKFCIFAIGSVAIVNSFKN